MDAMDAMDTTEDSPTTTTSNMSTALIVLPLDHDDTNTTTDTTATAPAPAEASSSSSSSLSLGRSSYWSYNNNEDGQPEVSGAVGLKNLGNTCFMNSTLQCLSHCVPLTQYFLDEQSKEHINRTNALGWKGRVAEEYTALLKNIWSNKFRAVAPREFKDIIGEVHSAFSGYAQHDSSELLSFLLDGLHEDLNRVIVKPSTNSVDSNGRPDAIVAEEAWKVHLMRNQSIIVDQLQGQFKSKVVCPIPECGKVSITFDPFGLLSVPLPQTMDTVVNIHLVYADPTRPVVSVGVIVSKQATLFNIKQAVCAAVGDISSPRRLVFADIFHSKVFRFFDDEGTVGDIRSNDIIYAYECPEIDEYCQKDSPAGGFYPIQVLFHKREANPSYNARYSYGHEQYRFTPIAIPRVICLPKKSQVTAGSILERLHQKIRPHLRSGDPQHLDAKGEVPLTRAEEESAYEPFICDDKGENCGHHEVDSWSRDKCIGCPLRQYAAIKQKEMDDEIALRAKTAASSKNALESMSSGSSIHSPNSWEAFVEDGEEKKDGGEEKEVDEGSNSAVIVSDASTSPSSLVKSDPDEPMMVSPDQPDQPVAADGTTDGFVQVEMVDADSSPAAAPKVLTNDDVLFDLRTQKSYMYSSEIIVKCSFILRLKSVESPVINVPTQADSPVVESDVASMATESIDISESPVSVVAVASPPPVPAFVPWFSAESASHEVKHASLDQVAESDAESVSIMDCIKSFAKEETLSEEDPWYCSNCKEHRQATKKLDLWKLPPVLVIHLKRFSYSKYSRDKISTFVNFPIVGLDLSEYTVNPAHHGELYDLFAVSNHMGGLGGGHYNAYARNHTNGCWYLHDDSCVSRVRRLSEIRSSSAYLLFYQRRAPGAPPQTEEEIEEIMNKFDQANQRSASSYSSVADLD